MVPTARERMCFEMNVSPKSYDRLPIYLQYLKGLPADTANISSTAIAQALGYGDVQVRKDLGAVSGEGKPRTGYDVQRLIDSLEKFLGYQRRDKAVLIGAGKLGMALFDYPGFTDYGLHISAAFDTDEEKAETLTQGRTDGRCVYPMSRLGEYCAENDVAVGIITTPADSAQTVCDLLCSLGIRAIWNFAPVHLTADADIRIQYENMAASLALLWDHLS